MEPGSLVLSKTDIDLTLFGRTMAGKSILMEILSGFGVKQVFFRVISAVFSIKSILSESFEYRKKTPKQGLFLDSI